MVITNHPTVQQCLCKVKTGKMKKQNPKERIINWGKTKKENRARRVSHIGLVFILWWSHPFKLQIIMIEQSHTQLTTIETQKHIWEEKRKETLGCGQEELSFCSSTTAMNSLKRWTQFRNLYSLMERVWLYRLR